jgi:hypothetical protein
MTHFPRLLALFLLIPFVVSCNVFAPFDEANTNQDHSEEGLQCLDQGDTNCAVSKYTQLPDGDAKFIPLCEIELSQAGLTLDVLVNFILNLSDTQTLLGQFVQALSPWSDASGTAMTAALITCSKISTASGDLSPLLQTLSMFVDCGLRIARAAQCKCVNNGQDGVPSADPNRPNPSCTVAGTNFGIVQKTDIATTSDGTINAVQPGICASELEICSYDFTQAAIQNLGNLGKIATALSSIPLNLRDSSMGKDAARAAIIEAFP